MTLHIDPDVVRTAAAGLTSAATTLTNARPGLDAARGLDLVDLNAVHRAAADRFEGVLTVAADAATELLRNTEDCLAAYARSDHDSAGTFQVLNPPQATDH